MPIDATSAQIMVNVLNSISSDLVNSSGTINSSSAVAFQSTMNMVGGFINSLIASSEAGTKLSS